MMSAVMEKYAEPEVVSFKPTKSIVHMQESVSEEEWYCDDWGCNGYSYEELSYGMETLFAIMGEDYYVSCDYYGCFCYDNEWDYSPYYDGGFDYSWEDCYYMYEFVMEYYYCDALADWYCDDWGCNGMSFEDIEYGLAMMYDYLYGWDYTLECDPTGCTEYSCYDDGTCNYEWGSFYGWCYWDELYGNFMDEYYSDYYGAYKTSDAHISVQWCDLMGCYDEYGEFYYFGDIENALEGMMNFFGYDGEIYCEEYGCYAYDTEGNGGFYYWSDWEYFEEIYDYCYNYAPHQCEYWEEYGSYGDYYY